MLLVATSTARFGVVCQDVSYLLNPANEESSHPTDCSYASSTIFMNLHQHYVYAILRRIQVPSTGQMFAHSLARVPHAENRKRNIHS